MLGGLLVGALLTSWTYALPAGMEHMAISKMRMADLETSASGYVYNQQPGLPVSYVQYTNHGSGRYYHAPDTLHYVLDAVAPVAPTVSKGEAHYESSPVLTYADPEYRAAPYTEQQPYETDEAASYTAAQLPKYVEPLVLDKPEPRAPYYEETSKIVDAKAGPADADKSISDENDGNTEEEEEEDNDDHSEDSENEDNHEDKEDKDDDEDDEDDDSIQESGKASGLDGETSGKGLDASNAHSTEAGNGKESSASDYQEDGEKGEKGYKGHHEFEDEDKGSYDNEKKKGYYEEKGGHKTEKSDADEKYGSSHDEEKSESGSDYGKKHYHNKGGKTSGFHNVYHKDEYKKDSDFYDDAHKEGHFEKYDTLNKKHQAAEGGFKKGDNHNSGFEHAEKGKLGQFDKGHEISHGQGYKAKEGEDSYHDNHSEYAKEGSASSGKKYGFGDDDGHH